MVLATLVNVGIGFGLYSIWFFACYTPTEPEQLYKQLDVPGWYQTAWIETSRCAGDKAHFPPVRFNQVDFYVVDVDSLMVNGIKTTAMATGWDIYLTRGVVDSTRIVKHEMMHVIGQIWSHPTDPFYRCKLMWGQ